MHCVEKNCPGSETICMFGAEKCLSIALLIIFDTALCGFFGKMRIF